MALIVRIGFGLFFVASFKGSSKGLGFSCKGSIFKGNRGALIIRIGCGGGVYYIIIIIRTPQNSILNIKAPTLKTLRLQFKLWGLGFKV